MELKANRSGREIHNGYGDVRIGDLRKIYGKPFALGFHNRSKLKNALELIDSASLHSLVRDHASGQLALMLGRPEADVNTAWAVGIQYAALPFRIRGRSVEVLMVEAPGRRLGIPRGWPIRGLSPPASAALGATSAMGLSGTPETVPVGSYDFQQTRKSGESVKVQAIVFPFRVIGVVHNTDPVGLGDSIWRPYQKAAARVGEPTLQRLIREFGKTRTPDLQTLLRGLRDGRGAKAA